MGSWSFYFLAKLACYAAGVIQLNWWLNAVFAVALMLFYPKQRRLRPVAGTAVAIALLWHESWLPGPARLLEALPTLHSFSFAYWLELVQRVFSWRAVSAWVLAVALYGWLAKRVRLGPVALAGLLLVPVLPTPGPASAALLAADVQDPTGTGKPSATSIMPPAGVPAEGAELDHELFNFYAQQRGLIVDLPQMANTAVPFDLVILSVCSLSWDDLAHAGLSNAAFMRRFDVLFKHFNSAASYSGPAVLRLMRGNCGQVPERELAEPAPASCHLLDHLAKAGFQTHLRLNHDGHFDGFADRVHATANFGSTQASGSHKGGPQTGSAHLPVAMISFDGSYILDDYAVLHRWSSQFSVGNPKAPQLMLYNTISLHDGNRLLDSDGRSSLMTWADRSSQLFKGLERWVQELERSGRRTVVVVVPEHGAGIRGDANQFPGLRELPSTSITHVPAGLLLLGFGDVGAQPGVPIVFDQMTSYTALVAAVAVVMQHPEAPRAALQHLAEQLPPTPWVAENQQQVLMKHQGRTYLRNRALQWREMAPNVF